MHSTSSFSLYLHLYAPLSQQLSIPPSIPKLPSLFHLSWNAFFLLSSPLFYCHCCKAKAQGFPPSFSQDRGAITAQKRERPAVDGLLNDSWGKTKLRAPFRGKKAILLACPPQMFILASRQRHIFLNQCSSKSREWGHHDQMGVGPIIIRNVLCYDLDCLSWLLNPNWTGFDSNKYWYQRYEKNPSNSLGRCPLGRYMYREILKVANN